MIDIERRALSALKFNLAPTPDDVWRPSPYHVAELHREVVESVIDGVALARGSDESSPLGVVIQGPAGAGKTHMLGLLRQRTQHDGGYFFLVSLLNGKTFWESTALCIVDGLLRDTVGYPNQLHALLRRLANTLGLSQEVREALTGEAELTPSDLDAFVAALRTQHRSLGQEVQDTARALVLHGCADFDGQDVGYAYLNSLDLTDYPQRTVWGLSLATRSAQQIVRDISRLLALTGAATVIGYDQLDTLFAQSTSAVHRSGEHDADEASLLGQVADGLMALREVTRRTLIVVSCLPDTWAIIKREAAGPVPDRFREGPMIHRVSSAKVGMAIVRKRLETRYADVGFRPPYATWPVKELAFTESGFFTPRRLLKRVEQHAAECLRAGRVVELEHLEDEPLAPAEFGEPAEDVADIDFTALDRRFASLRQEAHVDDALRAPTEDAAMPPLLAAGLTALVAELDDKAYRLDPPPSARPALHARLRQTLDESLEDEAHWCLRAIASANPNAVLSRVRAARTMAGLAPGVSRRKLFLLRNSPWPAGPTTSATLAQLHADGARTLRISPDDLRVFDALRVLLAEEHDHLAEWLASRTPASRTELFQTVLGTTEHIVDAPTAAVEVSGEPHRFAVRLGVDVDNAQPFDLDLDTLREHTVVFAGAGSGKTILLRRLVEECALKGVSAIVLDSNNERARLGDAWPEPPASWSRTDAAKARDFHQDTDVVVWTPGVAAGRPLVLAPLPDFAALRDPDQVRAAIDLAVAVLAPRAKVDGTTARAEQGQAVLRDALGWLAHRSTPLSLPDFVAVLADLHEGVTQLARGDKIAAELADTLTAAMVNDPSFGGAPTEVGQLLAPAAGRRARISVVSFAGLPSDDQRQSFVSQLQLALFAWIAQHPAGDQPLAGLLVLDDAQAVAPAVSAGPSVLGTRTLIPQAREHGLGLVFATQTPRGLHPDIPDSAATHLFGRLHSPIQLAAAKQLLPGGEVELDRLTAGQFYAVSAGQPPQRVGIPLCLSHHGPAPLTLDEVISRAIGKSTQTA